jgi:hypothetical protein
MLHGAFLGLVHANCQLDRAMRSFPTIDFAISPDRLRDIPGLWSAP